MLSAITKFLKVMLYKHAPSFYALLKSIFFWGKRTEKKLTPALDLMYVHDENQALNIKKPFPGLESSGVAIELYDCIIICGAYPGGKREYGGEFIKTRVDAYEKSGVHCLVIELSKLNTQRPLLDNEGKVGECWRSSEQLSQEELAFLSESRLPILIS